jgi:glycosyltransferase involved in cell wall biosynthesis
MISCLFITYNRSELLQISTNAIMPVLRGSGIPLECVVSDDCSSDEHRAVIQSIAFDTYQFSSENAGLGANCNSGLRACTGKYILQLQDDWLFHGTAESILTALEVLETDSDVGVVQLNTTHSDIPTRAMATPGGSAYIKFSNDLLPWARNCGVRPYSDQPHIKRREFLDDLGPYLEGVPMSVMENEFKKRVANQKRWQVASLSNTNSLFEHIGSEHSFRTAPHALHQSGDSPAISLWRTVRALGRRAFDGFDSIVANAVFHSRQRYSFDLAHKPRSAR